MYSKPKLKLELQTLFRKGQFRGFDLISPPFLVPASEPKQAAAVIQVNNDMAAASKPAAVPIPVENLPVTATKNDTKAPVSKKPVIPYERYKDTKK